MTIPKAKESLRDQLLARKRPTAVIPIQIADPTTAQRAVAYEEEAYRVNHLRTDDDRAKAITEARRKIDRAVKELDACYATITVRALPPVDFEKLVAAHPPRDPKDIPAGQEPDEMWNGATLPRALFLACADGELAHSEWETFLDEQCSQAERDQLYLAAQVINIRAPSYAVPKD